METPNASTRTPAKSKTLNSISKVRVVVRVRPFLPQEIAAKNGDPRSCVYVLDKGLESCKEVSVQLKDPDTIRNECYQLDAFFGQDDDNVSQIFDNEVKPFIPGIFQGCNATVFAYGATGSGKTYTMQGNAENPGLMPLSMSTILQLCQSTRMIAEISYYEVYMDRCYDLLEIKEKEITILDDKEGQIHLKGLSRVPVNSMKEFQEVFLRGVHRRKVAHTGLNDVSSRSHGVLVIAISSPGDGDSGGVVIGKLNLIDLAGNEDNRRTCNEGIRLQESAKINQSLFALSNVIYALNNNKPRVPYRESKLTRILQDSLGGTSHALMVACLNPGEYQESVHTVSLAARSRHVSNLVPSAQKQETPTAKIDMEARLRAWLESRGKTKSAQKMMTFGSPFVGKTPASIRPAKRNVCHSSAKVKTSTKQEKSVKERDICTPFRKLFMNEGQLDSCLESSHSTIEGNKEESAATNDVESKSTKFSSDEPMGEDKMIFENSVAPSQACEKKSAIRSSSRKALSPINVNDNSKFLEEVSSMDEFSTVLEPKTPKTPFMATSTPLGKFSAQSSRLKSSLMQEYIDFLNTASREELLEIKGIGLKLAEYILELRETNPIESLNDLEKLGLSSKQVYNLFAKAAKGIFDKPENTTPCCQEISEGL